MGPQHGRTPRKELQLLHDTLIEVLQQWDPDRLKGRDPGLVKALDKVRDTFQLKKRK